MIGPRFKPGFIFFVSSQSLLIIWSTSPTPTITEAAIQRCPDVPEKEAAISVAVISRSASGKTIRWFLAPPRARHLLRLEVALL